MIPREAEALFVAPPDKERSLAAAAEAFAAELREAYPVETGLTITCAPDNTGVAEIWDRASTQRFLRLLTEVPVGQKRVTVVTTHPEDSYRLEGDGKVVSRLVITDPARFWESSKVLIVSYK